MKTIRSKCFALEALEPRFCLSAGVGWDGPGQGTANLSYYVGSVPAGLDEPTVEATLEAALEVWSDVADVRFEETTRSGQTDSIDFRFTNIDGPGGTLALAYFPDDLNRNPIAGDVQFDKAETWEVGNSRGGVAFDLMLVAVHEIGHALGLDHSSAVDSVMRAAVSAYDSFTGLAAEDVHAILSLYAPAPTEPPAASDEPAATDPDQTLPQPDPVSPPNQPATPTDTNPDPLPDDGTDNPSRPDETEDGNPDAEDDPEDFTPNRFGHGGGWRHFPRVGNNFFPFFRIRFGRFPTTFINRINVTFAGRQDHPDSADQSSAPQQPKRSDDGQTAADQPQDPQPESPSRPTESGRVHWREKAMPRTRPASSWGSRASFAPVPSVVQQRFSRGPSVIQT